MTFTFAHCDDSKNAWLAERFQQAVNHLADAQGGLRDRLGYLLTEGALREVSAKDFSGDRELNLWGPFEELRRAEGRSEYDDQNPVTENLARCSELEVFILANHVVELLFALNTPPQVLPYHDFIGESHVAA